MLLAFSRGTLAPTKSRFLADSLAYIDLYNGCKMVVVVDIRIVVVTLKFECLVVEWWTIAIVR